MPTRTGHAAKVEPAGEEDSAATQRPESRHTSRLLAASLLLDLGRHDNRASRALVAALQATPARRVVPRNGPGDGDGVGGIARALRRTALRRAAPEERRWIGRIEARRTELAGRHGLTQAVFAPVPASGGGLWSRIFRPIPVSDACGMISIPPWWGLFLMRLSSELAPRSCVELGTGFGISGAYMAAGLELNGSGELTTFEGAERWATIAEEGVSALGLSRIEVRVGPLSETLEPTLSSLAPVDLAYVDADHTQEATLDYFATMLPRLSDGAVIVFDDIALNESMWAAWIEIRNHPRVALAASLGRMGLVRVSGRG